MRGESGQAGSVIVSLLLQPADGIMLNALHAAVNDSHGCGLHLQHGYGAYPEEAPSHLPPLHLLADLTPVW